MRDVPNLSHHLDKRGFLSHLRKFGAEILQPTNQWEVLRYRFNGGVHILYENKHHRLTYSGDTLYHYQVFLKASPDRVIPNRDPKPISEVLKGWPGAPDTSCEPSPHSPQSEDRREPATDHCEDKPPWE